MYAIVTLVNAWWHFLILQLSRFRQDKKNEISWTKL